MIEVIHPDLEVNDLVAHITKEVSRRHESKSCMAGNSTRPPNFITPYIWDQIVANLTIAAQHAYMGRSVPKMKRFWPPVRKLARFAARGILYVAQVFTKGQREFNVAAVNSIRDLNNWVRKLEQVQQENQQENQRNNDHVEKERMGELERAVEKQAAAFWKLNRDLQRQEGGLKDVNAALEKSNAALEQSNAALEKSSASLRDQARALTRLQTLLQQQEETVRAKEARIQTLEKRLAQLTTTVHVQEGRLRGFVEETRRRTTAPVVQPHPDAASNDYSGMDSLYLTFEDQFRGSREEIKTRLETYLPRIRQASTGVPIVDLGCGRGEWLELLRDLGMLARGVDLNPKMAEECRKRGLEVAEGDAIAYLRSLPDACLGAVTGFHVIEHLPWGGFVTLLDETVRVLKPGGLAIFETPNPENLIVGSCNFYADPTHYKPLFPPTIQFMAEYRGLVNVEILRLNQRWWAHDPLRLLPETHELADSLNPLIEIIKERFYGPPDFAVIGAKA
jgi:O-antigen chain-terminating methyltransferase